MKKAVQVYRREIWEFSNVYKNSYSDQVRPQEIII